MTRSCRRSSMWMSFSTSPSISLRDRDAGPLGHDLGHVLVVDLLLEEGLVGLDSCQPRLGSTTSSSSFGDLAVAELRRALEVGVALGALGLAVRLLEALLDRSGWPRWRPSRPASAPSSRSTARAGRQARARSPRGALRDASSFSFFSAWSSISSCWMRRSTSSISVGIESISMRSRDAASSIRSIALSGRKRSAM